MTFVTALLWVSLLIGPLITVSAWVWVGVTDPRWRALAAIGYGIISFTAAYWFATLALLIQILRDQWSIKLTGVSIAFSFLLFVFFVWIHTPPGKAIAEQDAGDQALAAVD